MSFVWDQSAIETAAKLWEQGASSGKIGKALGITPNAVIGKARRHPDIFPPKNGHGRGWAKGTARAAPGEQRQPVTSRGGINPNRNSGFFTSARRNGMSLTKKREAVRREASDIAALTASMPDPKGYDAERLAVAKPLHELARNECHWPLNQGGPFLFCGAKKQLGPYCMAHHVRSLPKRAVEV
ncbi:hypothetical protein EPK99_06530 [Neorhizobium lilium]|uniref:GcrA cell cycle regulator n=1 Tax=Neorhizobium lilium TaxID=2503024 RepID=A0A444LGY4_9HYPH|nr:GcrA family cell cycle regulator [Neorhizobium lilium]RWX78283.1 hypothetical protein EPK99_06530 [Neorhizobium lilium]